jgi:hypothetical protein
MSDIIRSSGWLNPLADNPQYEPMSAGMKTALPYVDVFAGLNILKDCTCLKGFLAPQKGLQASDGAVHTRVVEAKLSQRVVPVRHSPP